MLIPLRKDEWMWLKLCSEKWWSLSYGRSMDVQLPSESVNIISANHH